MIITGRVIRDGGEGHPLGLHRPLAVQLLVRRAGRAGALRRRAQREVRCLPRRGEAGDGGEIADPTAGADHYCADYIAAPKWARGRTPTAKIGRHLFFRLGLGG